MKKYICLRCDHPWKSRKPEKPKVCPKCKSSYWDRPKQRISKKYVEGLAKAIIDMQELIIEKSSGLHGVRDEAGVYNAAFRILRYEQKHVNDPVTLGAFIYGDLAKRHHFNDGNKRIAHCFAKSYLFSRNFHFKIDYPSAVDFIIKIAEYESKITLKEIEKWIKDNIIKFETKEKKRYLKELFYDITNKREEKNGRPN